MPHPHPYIHDIYTAESESHLDPNDTDLEMSIVLHSQDEDALSAEDTHITSPRVFHIPMSPPPRTLNEPLPGPSKVNTTNNTTATETH